MKYYEIEHFFLNQESLTVIGDQGFREVLANILYIIPKDVLNDVLSNCVFLMLNEKSEFPVAAAHIPKELISGKSILAFYEMLYSKDKDKQAHMILHEIAHYVLDHADDGLSGKDYYKLENKANDLVEKWTNDWKKHYKEIEKEQKNSWKE